MGYLDDIVPISELGQRKLVVLYGKSNTGKTELGSTWPTPMLYLQVGDDGANTIGHKEGIEAKRVANLAALLGTLKELVKKQGAGFETVFVDTFSMVTNIWVAENAVAKKKRMSQQMWGDIKTETEELIRLCHELAAGPWVVLSCHEATDAIEGMEEEILPDVRPSTTKGARTYLEGMANYGFHTTRLQKTTVDDKTGQETIRVKYGVHVGPNPYYWTKLQIQKGIKVPKIIINPTYDKIMEVLGIDSE